MYQQLGIDAVHAQIGRSAAHACIDHIDLRKRKRLIPPLVHLRDIAVLYICGAAPLRDRAA